MSTTLIIFTWLGVYVVGAVGTARAVFTTKYKVEYPRWVAAKARVEKDRREAGRYGYVTSADQRVFDNTAHYLTVHDSDVVNPTWWSGAFWFLVAPYLLVIKPVGTVVIPMIVKWFTGPARKAVAS